MAQFILGRAKAQMVKTLEEYYNAIQVNIQFSGSDIKVITVTSVQPSEGKSTTSTNLAVSFATSGYKTLLLMRISEIQSCQGPLKLKKPIMD